MATLETTKLHIAGIGHVFYAPVDTTPMTLDGFIFGDESTYGAWIWLGDTSSENLVEFKTDGGDTSFKRTWDRMNVRVIRAEETISATINSVNVSAETFNLGFLGHEYDAANKSYAVGSNAGSSAHAIMIVMEDGISIAAMYLPNTDIKGSFPTFDLENFTEIPLSLAILGSQNQLTPKGPVVWRWFEPRDVTTATPAKTPAATPAP